MSNENQKPCVDACARLIPYSEKKKKKKNWTFSGDHQDSRNRTNQTGEDKQKIHKSWTTTEALFVINFTDGQYLTWH